METSTLGSRLKAQLAQFSLALTEGLARPQHKFIGQMRDGLQASQDVKLSSIARNLQEKIPLVKTEDATWQRRSWRFTWPSGWQGWAVREWDATPSFVWT